MVSGQCRFGALINFRVLFPRDNVSPSLTINELNSLLHISFIKFIAADDPTIFMDGFKSSSFSIEAEWSGSVWFSTMKSISSILQTFSTFARYLSKYFSLDVSNKAVFSDPFNKNELYEVPNSVSIMISKILKSGSCIPT